MYECHGHIILSGENFIQCINEHSSGVKKDVVRARLKQYASSGVTFFRDGGDNMGVCAYAASIAAEYGIDYRSPIYAMHKVGCYGKFLGKSFSDMGQFRALADNVKKNGGNFIKIMASGILDFNEYGAVTKGAPSLNELKYIVKYCHDLGFSVMAHCSGRENVINALLAGCDSIEHGFYIDGEGLDIMRQNGTIWVPTATPVANLIGTGKFPDHVLTRIMAGHYTSITKAHEMGIPIAPGSDAGSGLVFPKSATRNEYDYLLNNTTLTENDLKTGAEKIKEKF